MKDDIEVPFNRIWPGENGRRDCVQEMIRMKRHTLDAEDTKAWARSLRFLSYAGPVEHPPAYNSDADSWRSWQTPWPKDEGISEVEFPRFPPVGPAFENELRLVEADELNLPRRPVYLAVSYCWQKDAEAGSYRVVGKHRAGGDFSRPSKAPDYVISAAIDCASVSGIRFIWIDQECIEQDDRDDKALGIQSMDLVYLEAMRVLGIIPEPISTPPLLAVLMTLKEVTLDYGECLRHDEPGRPGVFGGIDLARNLLDMATELCELLSMIRASRWFGRAWILQVIDLRSHPTSLSRFAEIFQENACAGNRMFLLFRISPKLLCGPQHSSADRHCWISFQALRWVLEPLADIAQSTSTILNALKVAPNQQWRDLRNVALDLLHTHPGIHYALVAFIVEPRVTLNAAQAVRFLRCHVNSRVIDRLAIVGNLCQYTVRLDTREDLGTSLSTAILLLSILNGDTSLLSGSNPDLWSTGRLNSGEMSWMFHESQSLETIYGAELGGSNLGDIYSLELADNGDLQLRGHCWLVDTKFCFKEIQSKYRDVSFLDSDETTTHPIYRNIYWDILLHLNSKQEVGLVRALWEILRKTHVKPPNNPDEPEPYEWMPGSNIVPQSFEEIQNPQTGEFLPRTGVPWLPETYSDGDQHKLLNIKSICSWPTERKVHLIRRRRSQQSEMADEIEAATLKMIDKEWIVKKIIKDGYLWCGRMVNTTQLDGHQDHETKLTLPQGRLACMFDIDAPCTVLCPLIAGIYDDAGQEKKGLQHLHFERVCWQVADEREPYVVQRMVRGIWSTEEREITADGKESTSTFMRLS